MDLLALTVAALAFMLCAGVTYPLVKRIERLESAPPPPSSAAYDDRALRTALDQHAEIIDALQQQLQDQNLAIAEGIKHVDRAERRVRAAVGRARRRMEELGYVDEGLEAEASELRYGDGDDSPDQGMLPMRNGVGQAPAGHPGRDLSSVFPGNWSGGDID